MKAFILSVETERDLDIIKRYLIDEAGVPRTRDIIREIRKGIRFIAKNPQAGHVRRDLTGDPVKFWSVFSYLIIYDPASSPVKIVRVLHAKRDVEDILE